MQDPKDGLGTNESHSCLLPDVAMLAKSLFTALHHDLSLYHVGMVAELSEMGL
jgi:hypothetical protein